MTQRTEARYAGIAYLSYIVFAMSSTILSAMTTAGEDTAQKLSTLARMMLAARVTVLLDLLQMVCALVLAVTLYRLSKHVDPAIALLALAFRVGEGLSSLPLLGKLELMRLATTHAAGTADPSSYLAGANEIFKRPDEVFGEFFFVVGGLLFAWLFLTGKLIPRWLAWTGVITIGIQTVCVPLHIASILPGSIVNWLWFPILFYEIPLGFWLLLKGVNQAGLTSGSRKHLASQP